MPNSLPKRPSKRSSSPAVGTLLAITPSSRFSSTEAAGLNIDAGLVDDARRLDKFYVSSRYPDALGGLDPTTMFGISEATEAATRASRFIEFAKRTIDEEFA